MCNFMFLFVGGGMASNNVANDDIDDDECISSFLLQAYMYDISVSNMMFDIDVMQKKIKTKNKLSIFSN